MLFRSLRHRGSVAFPNELRSPAGFSTKAGLAERRAGAESWLTRPRALLQYEENGSGMTCREDKFRRLEPSSVCHNVGCAALRSISSSPRHSVHHLPAHPERGKEQHHDRGQERDHGETSEHSGMPA